MVRLWIKASRRRGSFNIEFGVGMGVGMAILMIQLLTDL